MALQAHAVTRHTCALRLPLGRKFSIQFDQVAFSTTYEYIQKGNFVQHTIHTIKTIFLAKRKNDDNNNNIMHASPANIAYFTHPAL